MPSRSVHGVANGRISSFSWLNNKYSIIFHVFFLIIHLFADASVASISWLWWIMLQRTWEGWYPCEILISIPLDIRGLSGSIHPQNHSYYIDSWLGFFQAALIHVRRSGIAGSHGSAIFDYVRNYRTIFHSACIDLPSHQQIERVSFSPHPHQQLLSFGRWFLSKAGRESLGMGPRDL